MTKVLFIFFAILVLVALTAVRYRKQISGMIGIARMLKETTRAIGQSSKSIASDDGKRIPLVNCAKCSVWVPQNKSIKRSDLYFCSNECLSAPAKVT